MWKIVAIILGMILGCGGIAQFFSVGWISFGIGCIVGVVAAIALVVFGMSCWRA